MAQGGDTITYTFSGSKESEDISDITQITVTDMNGADGATPGGNGAGEEFGIGGSGGYLSSYTFDVSDYSQLDIWVGEKAPSDDSVGGFGRSDGGGSSSNGSVPAGGGGSTELRVDSNAAFIASVGAGGGGSYYSSSIFGTFAAGGGGGARGGQGGVATGADTNEGGLDAEGTGDGGDGGDVDYGNFVEDGSDGGAVVNSNLVLESGTSSLGGSSVGNGEIIIQFKSTPPPPANLQITDDATEDQLKLDWDEVSGAAGYYVYRAEASGSSPADYTQVADVTTPPYTDTALEDGERYYYRVSSHD